MYQKYERLRNQKGVNNSMVCRSIGIRTSVISDWKMGRYQPKVDKLQKLADYFGVDLEYFLEKETEDTTQANAMTERQVLTEIRDLLLEIKELKSEIFGR